MLGLPMPTTLHPNWTLETLPLTSHNEGKKRMMRLGTELVYDFFIGSRTQCIIVVRIVRLEKCVVSASSIRSGQSWAPSLELVAET